MFNAQLLIVNTLESIVNFMFVIVFYIDVRNTLWYESFFVVN